MAKCAAARGPTIGYRGLPSVSSDRLQYITCYSHGSEETIHVGYNLCTLQKVKGTYSDKDEGISWESG